MKLFTWLGLSLALLSLACSSSAEFEITPNVGCFPPPPLRGFIQQKGSVPACLRILWVTSSGPKGAAFPALLQSDGNFSTFTRQGIPDAKKSFQLPSSSKGQSLSFELMVMQFLSPPSYQDIKQRCDAMANPDYSCFSAKNPICWMKLQFSPSVSDGDFRVLPIPRSCRWCQREKCDGLDNNCNNRTDEFDEVNNRSCTP